MRKLPAIVFSLAVFSSALSAQPSRGAASFPSRDVSVKNSTESGAARSAPPEYAPDDVAREFLWQEFGAIPPGGRPKVGVALSGGGARGFAHVGVLETLSAAGFPVDCLAGTSMGAVVGSFFSAGLPFSEIWEIGRNASFSNVSRDFNALGALRLLLGQKLMSSNRTEDFINSHIGNITFDRLKIPFSCSAMDIKTGERVLFREGPVAIGVRASMNLPGIFSPVEYRQRYLVDGGVVDFLPVRSARSLCADWVLASVTLGDYSAAQLNSILSYMLQVQDIRGALLAQAAMKEADFVVSPQVSDISINELDRSVESGERGVVEMARQLDRAKESLLIFSANDILRKYK
ncbi:MAG: patatin-like phospholipase family protein [Elusimicrobiales bacterium]|nr:patatin-like phospholipase family protein [Elusimicrobiales bacterium]